MATKRKPARESNEVTVQTIIDQYNNSSGRYWSSFNFPKDIEEKLYEITENNDDIRECYENSNPLSEEAQKVFSELMDDFFKLRNSPLMKALA